MERAELIARLVLGSILVIFGLNGFLHFYQYPMPEEAITFRRAIGHTGYLHEWLKGTEVVCGVLLLTRRFVPLALAVLAPVILNIAAFHLFLDPHGNWVGALLVGLLGFLAYTHRGSYAAILRP